MLAGLVVWIVGRSHFGTLLGLNHATLTGNCITVDWLLMFLFQRGFPCSLLIENSRLTWAHGRWPANLRIYTRGRWVVRTFLGGALESLVLWAVSFKMAQYRNGEALHLVHWSFRTLHFCLSFLMLNAVIIDHRAFWSQSHSVIL